MGFWPLASEPLASNGGESGMFAMSITESLAASDSYGAVNMLAVTILETLATSDSYASQASLVMALSETANAVEQLAGTGQFTASVVEATVAGDGILVGLLYELNISETALAAMSLEFTLEQGVPVIKGWVAQSGKTGIWIPVGVSSANWSATPGTGGDWIPE